MKMTLLKFPVAIAVFFCSLLLTNSVSAQMGMHLLDNGERIVRSFDIEDPLKLDFRQDEGARVQAFFVELGGPGLIVTFNYDTRFNPGDGGLGIRAGFGGFAVAGEGFLAIPVQLNYLLGTAPHYFEIGIGASLFTGKFEFLDSNNSFTTVLGTMAFGYRLQPTAKGFQFRAGVYPFFGDFDDGFTFIPWYPGISFGYAFTGKLKE